MLDKTPNLFCDQKMSQSPTPQLSWLVNFVQGLISFKTLFSWLGSTTPLICLQRPRWPVESWPQRQVGEASLSWAHPWGPYPAAGDGVGACALLPHWTTSCGGHPEPEECGGAERPRALGGLAWDTVMFKVPGTLSADSAACSGARARYK